jgi:hypothetical protein
MLVLTDGGKLKRIKPLRHSGENFISRFMEILPLDQTLLGRTYFFI